LEPFDSPLVLSDSLLVLFESPVGLRVGSGYLLDQFRRQLSGPRRGVDRRVRYLFQYLELVLEPVLPSVETLLPLLEHLDVGGEPRLPLDQKRHLAIELVVGHHERLLVGFDSITPIIEPRVRKVASRRISPNEPAPARRICSKRSFERSTRDEDAVSDRRL